jgi:hypothetical protein
MSGAAQAEQILADPEANRRLLRDGFVVMPLVDASLARRLRTSFDELNPAEGSGFQSDLLSDDPAYRAAADGAIQLLDPAVEQLFVDRRAFLRSFLCKHPGEASELYLHRDWMYVDERSGARTYSRCSAAATSSAESHGARISSRRGWPTRTRSDPDLPRSLFPRATASCSTTASPIAPYRTTRQRAAWQLQWRSATLASRWCTSGDATSEPLNGTS